MRIITQSPVYITIKLVGFPIQTISLLNYIDFPDVPIEYLEIHAPSLITTIDWIGVLAPLNMSGSGQMKYVDLYVQQVMIEPIYCGPRVLHEKIEFNPCSGGYKETGVSYL